VLKLEWLLETTLKLQLLLLNKPEFLPPIGRVLERMTIL
jgi:hypothetical protein